MATFDETCELAWKRVQEICAEDKRTFTVRIASIEDIANAVVDGNAKKLETLLPARPKHGYLFRQKGEDGKWSSWKLAELSITSLLVKAQDRPEEYQVEEVVSIESLPEEMQSEIVRLG
jgi:hypothetical protein